MFPLVAEPLPPARPEIAEAAPYTSCGCVHHSRSAPSSPLPEVGRSLRTPSERSRFFAEASEARRRMNQCRDWASVVAGAARDAVHFNVVDAGAPYASQRTLPAFYYDPDAHEPQALSSHSHPHSCCTSPHGDREQHEQEDQITDARSYPSSSAPAKWHADEVKTEVVEHEPPHQPHTTARATTFLHYRPEAAAEYNYARVEVLDEKPRRLNVEPHLEGSALRKRRCSHNAPPPPAQRIKLEITSPTEPTQRQPTISYARLEGSSSRPSSVPAAHSPRLCLVSSGTPSLTNASTTDNRSGTHDRGTEPPPRPRSRPTRASERPATSELGLTLGLEAQPLPRPQPQPRSPTLSHLSLPTRAILSTQSAPADAEQGRAPDQDSPQRVCEPLPSIGGLWCARDSAHDHSSSHSHRSTPKSSNAKSRPTRRTPPL